MIDIPVQHYVAGGSASANQDEEKLLKKLEANVGQATCGGCFQKISDRFLLKVGDVHYHETCLQCCSCSLHLNNTCFVRNGKVFCRMDYERLFVKNRCLNCGEKISSDEFVMRASAENVFHLKCFVCVVCGGRLQKGDQYVIKQSQLFCRPDYEKEVEMMQGFNYDEFNDEMYASRIDGRRGPKRPRTILTTQQRRAFKASFDITPKPCRKVREGLAKDTGLSIRIVQVWFQNQRAKVKKIQKKQAKEPTKVKTEQATDAEDSNDSKSSAKGKVDSPRSANTYLPDSGSDDNEQNSNGGCGNIDIACSNGNSSMPFHHQTVAVKQEMMENLENSEEFFRFMSQQQQRQNFTDAADAAPMKADVINFPAPPPFIDYLAPPQPPPHILNPIDRLYSMQNAYFCANNGNSDNENMHPLDPTHHYNNGHLLGGGN